MNIAAWSYHSLGRKKRFKLLISKDIVKLYHKMMRKSLKNWMRSLLAVASYDVHYDQIDAYGNFSLFDQTQTNDGTWNNRKVIFRLFNLSIKKNVWNFSTEHISGAHHTTQWPENTYIEYVTINSQCKTQI